MAAAGTNGVSQDQSSYIKYVLYVLPEEENSIKAVQIGARFNEIKIININTLPKSQRPPWLTGVPTLANLEKGVVFKGTEALVELKKQTEEPLFHGLTGPSSAGFDLDGAGDGGSGSHKHGSKFSGKMCAADFVDTSMDDSRYSGTSRVKGNEVDAYLQQRDRLASKVASSAGSGPPPPESEK